MSKSRKPTPPDPKRVTGWLCLHPEEFRIQQIPVPVDLPDGVLALLAVYATREAAQAVHGPDCKLAPVSVPVPEKRPLDIARDLL